MENMYVNPELEAQTKYMRGSKLDKLFDFLSTAGYAAGGVDYYREQAVAQSNSSVERALINAAYGVPVFGLAVGLTSESGREAAKWGIENRLEVAEVRQIDSFWGGLGTNIVYDPLSYLGGVGAVKGVVGKVGMRTISMLPDAAKGRALVGAGKIAQLDNAAMAMKARVTDIAAKPIRKAGAFAGRQIIKGAKGAGKDVHKILADAGSRVGGVRDVFGEVFQPGYKLKKLGGPMSQYYDDYMDMVVSKRGAVSQAFFEVKEMGKPFKNSGALAMDYVERGVSTGVEGLDKYLDDIVKPFLSDIRGRELAAGYDVGEIAGYAPHILSSKGKKLISKYGSEEGVVKYLKDQAQIKYGLERQLTGSVSEINELLGNEYFVSDLWQAVGVRAQRSASDLATTSWLKHVGEKYGMQETDKITEKVYTKAAIKAQGKIEEYRSISDAFYRASKDIAAGKPAPQFMANWIDQASRGTFGDTKLLVQGRVRKITQRSESVSGALASLRTTGGDITRFEAELKTELTKHPGSSRTISREISESLFNILQSAIDVLPKREEAVKRAQDRARSDLMQIGADIIDPLQRKISGLESAASKKKTVKVLKDSVEDGIEYIQTKRKDISTMLPADIAKHLDELQTIDTEISPIGMAGKVHDKVLNLWKRSVTLGFGPIIFTSFFGRNIYTGISQNIQQVGAVKATRGIYDAMRLWRGKGTFETLERGKVTATEMERMMRESGQMGGTGMSDLALSEKMYPTLIEKIWDLGGQAMKWSEATVREPLFLAEIRHKSLKQTAKSVKETHFDYAPEALTPTERVIKKFGVPFYTFTRFNIERQVKQLIKKPKQFERLGQIQRESLRAAELQDEYEARPEWQEGQYLVPNPLNQEQFISLSIPQLGVLGAGNPYFQLTPFKSALEYLAIDAGWGSDEYKAEKKKALRKQMAGGRYISTRKKLLDTETEQQQKMLYMAGFNTYTPAPLTTTMEQFEQYRYRLIQPTKDQEFKAWQEAGMPEGFAIDQIEPSIGAVGTAEDIVTKAKWWERLIGRKDTVVKALVKEYQLAVLSPEIRDMGRGYPWTEAERVKIQNLKGQELTSAVTGIYENWNAWKTAQAGIDPATTQERMAAWVRSGEPGDATDKVYRNAAGKIIGIASFERNEIEKINDYINRHVRISNAAYEWAFTQTDVTPEEFILKELDKENAKYLSAQAAQEELKGFAVDQPIPAGEVNITQQMEYSQYRQNRVNYEQELMEKALGRGETI